MRGTVLLLVATLDAGALEQLAVLLLGHPLAPLLDNRAHDYPRSLLITRCLGAMGPHDLRGASLPAPSECLVIEGAGGIRSALRRIPPGRRQAVSTPT